MPDNEDSSQINWDGAPLTKQAWLTSLPDMLADKGHRTLWERGFTVYRNQCITTSPSHSYHLLIDNIKECTFESPMPTDMIILVDDTINDKDLTELQQRRYVDFLETIKEARKNLFTDIAKTILNIQRRNDYKAKTKGCGIAMLTLLESERVKETRALSQWASTRRAEHVLKGLTSATSISFDQFRHDYETFTHQMGARAESDMIWAEVYCQAVRDLGELISTRLDLRLEVDKPSTLAGYVDVIHTTLTKEEMRPGVKGRALGLGAKPGQPVPDPRKHLYDASGSRVYVRGTDETCNLCTDKTPSDGGHHLRIHCAHYIRPAPAAEGKGGRKGKGGDRGRARSAGRQGAARSAGAADEDHCPSSNEDEGDATTDGDEADSDFYEDDEQSNITADEIAISKLFESGVPGTVEASPGRTGSARVAGGRGTSGRPAAPPAQPGGTPARSAAPPAQPETPPAPLPYLLARARIEALTPDSPIAAFRAANVDTGLQVSLATGGVGSPRLGLPPNRSRLDILNDMRAALGMSPSDVPVGIAVDDGGDDRPPPPLEGGASICMLPGCTRPRFVDGLTGHATCSRSHHAALAELQTAAAAIATAAAAPIHPPIHPPAEPPPAPPAQPPPAPPAPPPPAPTAPVAPALPAAQPDAHYIVGAPCQPPRHSAFGFTAQQLSGTGYTASASQRVSDGAGGISTVYTFTGHADVLRTLFLDTLTGTCGAMGALLVATAPAGAVLLGGCMGHTYWIADGAIVRTDDTPPPVTIDTATASGGVMTTAVIMLLTVIVALLAFIASVMMATPPGSAVTPWPEPGATIPRCARALAGHITLRGLLSLLAACASACLGSAFACAHAVSCGASLASRLALGLSALAVPPLGAAAGTALAWTGSLVGSLALVFFTPVVVGYALWGGYLCIKLFLRCLLQRVTVSSPMLLRLRPTWGRVCPLIPPQGHHRLLHTSRWISRFAPLKRTCGQLISSTPPLAMLHSPVQLLCLLCQYAIVSALDMGCHLLNHRTTPAGLAPHGAILDGNGDVAATAAGCVTHTARRARQLLIHIASWTVVVAASALNWANRTSWNSQATHHRWYGWLDRLLGHHTNGSAARATLKLLHAPYLASI